MPFHRRIRVWLTLLLGLLLPTAQALTGEPMATPLSWSLLPGLGLATRVHVVPFHRRIRVLMFVPGPEKPTAQASVAEPAATP